MLPLLASDALAAVAALAHHAAVDRSRMGLYGLSQGGWVVPNAAARSTEIAFVAIVSGSAVTLGEEEFFSSLAHLEGIRAAQDKPWRIAVFPDADHILFEDRRPCQFGGHEVDWLAPLFAWAGQVLGPSSSG